MTITLEKPLSDEEVSHLEQLAEGDNVLLSRRARLLLMVDNRRPYEAIAEELGLSTRTVRQWVKRFNLIGMDVFLPGWRDAYDTRGAPGKPMAGHDTPEEPGEAGETVEEEEEEEEEEPGGPESPPEPVVLVPTPAPTAPSAPGIRPDDPMSEAGRKLLLFHFTRVLENEEGTGRGEDIEALHDMRVATRRIRAVFRVFGEFYEPGAIKPLLRGVRRTTRALGGVRDLDVFMEKAHAYSESLAEEDRGKLSPLIDEWKRQRETAREKMISYLQGEKYTRFKRDFSRFVETEEEGAVPIPRREPVPYQVRHVAPRLIYTRYEAVRAYEPLLQSASIEMLHALRIEFKYLRYTVEFFLEVLGDSARSVVKDIVKMQDHLGDLHDADVACSMLSRFLAEPAEWEDRQTNLPLGERYSPEHIAAYLVFRHAERHRLLTSFPESWEWFTRPEFRRKLAKCVAEL